MRPLAGLLKQIQHSSYLRFFVGRSSFVRSMGERLVPRVGFVVIEGLCFCFKVSFLGGRGTVCVTSNYKNALVVGIW